MNIDKELLKKSSEWGIRNAMSQGLPKDVLKGIVKNARIMGDVMYVSRELGIEPKSAEYDQYFSDTRKRGIDDSVEFAYGGSTVPSIAAFLRITHQWMFTRICWAFRDQVTMTKTRRTSSLPVTW